MPTPIPALNSVVPYCELIGSLGLAGVGVSLRLQYLMCRLSVGITESCVKTQLLKAGALVPGADHAELEERVMTLLETSAEGCATIVRGYIEEITQAQHRCLRAALGMAEREAPALGLPFTPGVAVPGARSTAKVASGRE